MPPKGKKGKGKLQQHALCSPLSEGEQLKDLRKKIWTVGNSIGKGGFGLIYKADEGAHSSIKDDSQYVIKVEPKGNGPLFCEIAFYQRAAKNEQIEEWKRARKLKFLGIPKFVASGIYERKSETLRFLVMPRFGRDLQATWEGCGKSFTRKTVAQIALQMLDALEYCHSKEYVHADIKGANIISSYKDPNKLFLVDFGLAHRYSPDGNHRPYKADPRKAHNGTIEYTSTDAHMGAEPSRRGDLEILGYCLLHWLCGGNSLPWEKKLTDCNFVFEQKKKFCNSIDASIKKIYPGQQFPDEIKRLFTHALDLEYDEEPEYNKLRQNFEKTVKTLGGKVGGPLDFSKAKGKGGKPTPGSSEDTSSSSAASVVPAKKARKKPASSKPPAKKARPVSSKASKRAASTTASSGDEIEEDHSPPASKTNGKSKLKVAKPATRISPSVSASKDGKKRKISRPLPIPRQFRLFSTDSNSSAAELPIPGMKKQAVIKKAAVIPGRSQKTKKKPPPALESSRDESEEEESDEEVVIPEPKKKKEIRKKRKIVPKLNFSVSESENDQSSYAPSEEEDIDVEIIDGDDVDEIPETQDVDDAMMTEEDDDDDVIVCDVTEDDVKDDVMEENDDVTEEDEDLFEDAEQGEEDDDDENQTPSTSKQNSVNDGPLAAGASTSSSQKVPLKETKTENLPKPTAKRTSPRLKAKKAKSSRYSMAPLHTESVLTKTDVLTGEMCGKHPVFIRSWSNKAPKTDASTQVTPSLRKNRPRVKKKVKS